MGERVPFEIETTTLHGIEARGQREFMSQVDKNRADEGLPPLTEEQRFEVEVAFNCGCRHVESELARLGAIHVKCFAISPAPAQEGTVSDG